MKTYHYFMLLVLGGLVASCKGSGDIFKATPISGSVVIKDDYLELDERVPASATLKLKTQGMAADKFLYEIKSSNGEFTFVYVPDDKDKLFSVKGEVTETEANKASIIYSDSGAVTNDRCSLKLQPQYRNGIKIKILRNNEPLNAANIYLFVNKTQADSAKKLTTIVTPNAVFSAAANTKGIAFFSNLQDTDYYILVRATLPKKDTILTKRRPSLGKDILKDAVMVNIN